MRPIPFRPRRRSRPRSRSIAPGAVLAGSQGPRAGLGGNRHGMGLAQPGAAGPALPRQAAGRRWPRRAWRSLAHPQLVAAEPACGTPGTLGGGDRGRWIEPAHDPHRAPCARFPSVADIRRGPRAPSSPARIPPAAGTRASDRRPAGSRREAARRSPPRRAEQSAIRSPDRRRHDRLPRNRSPTTPSDQPSVGCGAETALAGRPRAFFRASTPAGTFLPFVGDGPGLRPRPIFFASSLRCSA